jgi:hypothetical protein
MLLYSSSGRKSDGRGFCSAEMAEDLAGDEARINAYFDVGDDITVDEGKGIKI